MSSPPDPFNSSGSQGSDDPVVSNCPICDRPFHQSSLEGILEMDSPYGTCKRCGAWLALIVEPDSSFGWFLIGFGRQAIPLDGEEGN